METELGRIPSHWEVGSFEEDLKIQGRIGWKGYKTSDLVPIGPYVIGGGEIKSNIFLQLEHAQRISREKYNESPEIMLKEGDVLLVTRGNLGEVGYYHGIYGEGTINPSVIILNNFNGDSKFLFYYLISKQGKANVLSLSSGSSVPAIYQADVYTLKYPKPPIDEQTKISKIAFSIDLKIDLLHRQNATLEKMAETLFRQWFVEEAKEDWVRTKIGDVLDTVLGGTPSTKKPEYWDGNIPWINSGEVNNFRILQCSRFITELGLKKSNTKLLPVGTTVLAITGATLGQVSLLEIDTCANQSVVGIIPNGTLPKEFIFLWIKMKISEIILSETGGAQPHINKNDINETDIVIPDSDYLNKIKLTIEPLFKKITHNSFQIRTLTALRDTLLPKLMSGEVRVD